MKQFYYAMLLVFLSSLLQATGSVKNPNHNSAFIENKGQIVDQWGKSNDEVKFLFHMAGLNVQLRRHGFSYDTYQYIGGKNKETAYHRVDIELIGSNPDCELVGELPAGDLINMISAGKDGSEILGIRSFERVVYKHIYPNIDLVFERKGDQEKGLEYNFVVHPGGDASLIRMKYEGANSTDLKDEQINISVAGGNFTERIPASFVVSNYSPGLSPVKQKHAVGASARYSHAGNGVYSFDVAAYDKRQTLVIDPTPTLVWGTYYEGDGAPNINNAQSGEAVVYDPTGNVYMTGYTKSPQNISTSGAHQFIIGANSVDAYIVKMSSSGTRLWATYYGGNNNDYATNMAIDALGNIYVCGYTESPTQIASTGSHQPNFGGITGDEDAFLVKFNSNGVRQWGTYYGGSSPDRAYGVAVDASGNVFLAGYTNSSSAISTAGAHQAAYGGNLDAFLVKFNSSGVRQWATYYGDTGADQANEVAVDAAGDIYMVGTTNSGGTAIATAGAFQTSSGSGFLVKFNTSGLRQWGTFINASLQALAIDGAGDIYVTGDTYSSVNIATPGTHQSALTGFNDAVIMKFSPAGTRTWGTYYGGTMTDSGNDIAVDNANGVYITGYTQSDYHANLISGCSFKSAPTHFSTYHTNNALIGNDAGYFIYANMFIAKFNAQVGTRQWGTFFGESYYYNYAYPNFQPIGNGIATANNAAGEFYLAGRVSTYHHLYNVSIGNYNIGGSYAEITHGAVDSTISNNSWNEICASILAKFNEGSVSGVDPTPAPVNAINAYPGTTVCSGLTVTLSLSTGTLSPGANWAWYEYPNSAIPLGMTPIGTGTSVVVTNTLVGTKIYQVRAENGCGKSISRFIIIKTNPNPDEPGLTDSTFACQGASLFLNSNGNVTTTPYYSWSGPGGFAANTKSVVVTNNTTLVHAGWYYATNTNSYGCQKKDSTYVKVGDSLKVTVTPSITVCQGVTINLNATSSLQGSHFYWQNNYTESQNFGAGPTNTITAGSYSYSTTVSQYNSYPPINGPNNSYWYNYTGTYSVTVQNSGCQKTFTVPVMVKAAPYASMTLSAGQPYDYNNSRYLSCAGASYSYSAAPVSGATYSWSSTGGSGTIASTLTAAAQNATLATAPNANYYSRLSYTVSDVSGCVNEAAIDIMILAPNTSLTDTIRPCVGTTFNLGNNSAAPSYTWSGPGGFTSNAASPSFTNANSAAHDGNYIADMLLSTTYYDQNSYTHNFNCVSRDSIRVLVKALPTATITSNASVCLYTPLSFSSTPVAYVSNGNYQWQSANVSASGQTITAYPSITGIDSVTLTLTDKFGCVGTVTAAIMVNALPTVTTSGSTSLCEGDTIRLFSASPTATSYSWTSAVSGTNTTVATTQSVAVFAADVNYSGGYDVQVTDANGCKNTATQYVTVKYTPALVASNTATICQNTTINLNAYGYLSSGVAVGANLLHWTGPNTYTATGPVKTIPNATPANSGYYVVSASLNGCVGKDSVEITVSPLPLVSASANSPLCAGDTLKISGMPNNLAYAWNVPSGFNSGNQNLVIGNAGAINAGTYTLTGTDANGCVGKAMTTVTINPLPVAVINNLSPSLCEGSAISLTTSTVTGNSYAWTGPNGFSSSSPSVTINNAAMSHSGTYSLTVTNSNGCKTVKTTNVTVNYQPILSASALSSVVCIGGSISLQANAYTSNGFVINGGSIFWSGPGSYSSTGNNPTIPNATNAMSGTYTVTVVLGSCSATETVAILVNNAAPTLTATSNSPVCPGSAVTLSVNAIPGATYLWSGPNGYVSTTQNPVINNSTTQMSGIYSVTVSAGSCSSVSNVSVSVTGVSALAPGVNAPLCLGGTIHLTVPSISGASYAWSGPGSYTSSVQSPTITGASMANAGTYTVTASFGSCSSTGTVNVTIIDPSSVSVAVSGPDSVCIGSFIELAAGSTTSGSYSWSGPHGYSSVSQNISLANADSSMSGTYMVTLNFGCGTASNQRAVFVKSCEHAPEGLSVPEGFSPNGDGINDHFVIKGILHYPDNTITIFNRWGNEVYTASPYTNQWDGRMQKGLSVSGDELPVGTYFYILDPGDGSKVMRGYIYLTR